MQDINVIYERAKVALSLQKNQFAIRLAEEILIHNPNDEFAYYIISRSYFNLDQYNEAEKYIKLALKYSPEDEYNLALYSNILLLKKEYTSALNISDDTLAINPKQYTALFVRVSALKYLKEYKRAEELAKYALSIYPNSDTFHKELGDIYSETNQIKLAEQEFLEALRINPNDSVTLNNFGVYFYDNKIKKGNKTALELFKRSLQINPNDKTVIENYQTCVQKQNKLFVICKFYKDEFEYGISYRNLLILALLYSIFIFNDLSYFIIFVIITIPSLIIYFISNLFIKNFNQKYNIE